MTRPPQDETPAPRRVFRFAPSPNGYLHRGHALSALLNFRAANSTGGRFLLRIEDIDVTRSRKDFEAAIYEDLAWLGIAWEKPVLRQSERIAAYRAALDEFTRMGSLYPAFLSRAEMQARIAEFERSGQEWPRDPDGAPHYPGEERLWPDEKRKQEMAGGRPFALRLDMQRAAGAAGDLTWREVDPFGTIAPSTWTADPRAWGDVVLARKEVPASYHLAVVVDDAFQGVSDVVRGKDLRQSTSVHRLLQALLGLPEPRYFHHRLILDGRGEKLSKSRGSESIRARRAAGETPAEVIAGLDCEGSLAA